MPTKGRCQTTAPRNPATTILLGGAFTGGDEHDMTRRRAGDESPTPAEGATKRVSEMIWYNFFEVRLIGCWIAPELFALFS